MKQRDTVRRMVASLVVALESQGVALHKAAKLDDVHQLDDLCHDGGETRCEHFGDLAYEYAAQFDAFASDKFDAKVWECMKAAWSVFKRENARANR